MEFKVINDENKLLTWLNLFLDSNKDDVNRLLRDEETRNSIIKNTNNLVYQAYIEKNQRALESIHNILQIIYNLEFSSASIDHKDCERKPILTDITSILEVGMMSHESTKISKSIYTDYPKKGDEFVRWFKSEITSHHASMHEFYQDYLPTSASVEDIRYFLAQETCLDPRFDDILALMQLGTSGQEKMEIASNYWDEMGNGKPEGVHTKLFSQALDCLDIGKTFISDSISLDAKMSGNLSACIALNRRQYFKAVGYFGVTEYLAPRRFKSLVNAWHRLELPKKGIEYHELHVKIDAVHGNAWLRNVIKPLIDKDYRIGQEIIEGAFIRLNSSDIYLDSLLESCKNNTQNEGALEMGYGS